jgi:hypothetical protein
MADNVGYTPGTGATIAADDVGGTLYQRVKIAHGDDGTATDASVTNPLPVYDEAIGESLGSVIALLDSPRGYDKSLQRQRSTVILESGTVTSVNNIVTIDSIQGRIAILGENLSAWSSCVRARIS